MKKSIVYGIEYKTRYEYNQFDWEWVERNGKIAFEYYELAEQYLRDLGYEKDENGIFHLGYEEVATITEFDFYHD